MITSESIYKALLNSLRKEKRGYSVSPTDLNESVFVIMNKAMWDKYCKSFEDSIDDTIAMMPFKIFNSTISLTSGAAVLPANFDRIMGRPRSTETVGITTYTRTLDIVTSNEYSERAKDYLTEPSATYPVCVFGGTPTGTISAVADYSGTHAGTVLITSAAHGLSTGHYVLVSGTTSYNGGHTITKVDANSFYFTATYVSSQTGTWTGQNMKKISVYPASLTSIYIDYLRQPETPFLDYYFNNTTLALTFLAEGATHVNVPSGSTYRDGSAGGAAVYVDSLTVNLEWDDGLFDEILGIMQNIVAVQLQDTTISNNQQQ